MKNQLYLCVMDLNIKKIIVSSALILAANETQAIWQMPISNYPQSVYQAGTQNWQVAQRQDDWLYIANNYGLLEFDGSRWTLYGISNSSAVRSICIDELGHIYVGGDSEYGRFESNGLGGLSYISLSTKLPEENMNFGEVWNIHRCRNKLYVQTDDFIFIHNIENDHIDIVESINQIKASELVGETLYIATTEGISFLDGNKLSKSIAGTEQLSKANIRKMLCIKSNKLLIATSFDGLFILDQNGFNRFKTVADKYVSDNMLYSIAVNGNQIAQGTVTGGIAITDYEGKNVQYVNTCNGLQNNTILSLYFDKSDNLWCGLDQGIDCISIDSPMLQLYNSFSSLGSGYTQLIDGNKIYLGTNRGLYYASWPLIDSDILLDAQQVSGSLGQVWSIDKIGETLFCCHDKGLFYITNEQLLPILENVGFWQIRPLPLSTTIAIAGSYNGLYLIRPDQFNKMRGGGVISKIEGFDSSAKTFEIDSSNRIWIVTEKGIERLTLNVEMTRCSSELILPRSNRNIYSNIIKLDDKIIVSQGEESFITDASNNLSNMPGLLQILDGANCYYSNISKDSDETYWYITGDALKVRRKNPVNGMYDPHPTIVWNIPKFYVYGFTDATPIGNSEIMISCVQGFALGDLNKALRNIQKNRPKLFIRQLESITPTHEEIYFGASYPKVTKEIEMPYASNSIRISYGYTKQPSECGQLSCKLINENRNERSKFTNIGSELTKEYTFLKPGKYTFFLRMSDANGNITQETSISFRILPPWYRTQLAIVIFALILLLLLYGIIFVVRRRSELSEQHVIELKDNELESQKMQFSQEVLQRENEILQLQNEKIESELKSKSQELANILLNNVNRNELIIKVKHELTKISEDLRNKDTKSATRRIALMQSRLTQDSEQKVNWVRFEENYDIVYDKFIKKLQRNFPWISINEKKLCIYIHMGLLNKEIAPLMNISVRGVEMLRYRMRKKMELSREDDLENLFKSLE